LIFHKSVNLELQSYKFMRGMNEYLAKNVKKEAELSELFALYNSFL